MRGLVLLLPLCILGGCYPAYDDGYGGGPYQGTYPAYGYGSGYPQNYQNFRPPPQRYPSNDYGYGQRRYSPPPQGQYQQREQPVRPTFQAPPQRQPQQYAAPQPAAPQPGYAVPPSTYDRDSQGSSKE